MLFLSYWTTLIVSQTKHENIMTIEEHYENNRKKLSIGPVEQEVNRMNEIQQQLKVDLSDFIQAGRIVNFYKHFIQTGDLSQ